MQITLSGVSALQRFAQDLERAAEQAPVRMAGALNQAGAAIRRQLITVEARQTGLPARTMTRALKEHRAGPANLSYEITAEGGNVSLRYFGAKETPLGVTARPWGMPQMFKGAFIKGGRFPDRVSLPQLNGQVYRRDGKSRLPIDKLRSGVFIPSELIKGVTLQTFERFAERAGAIVVQEAASLLR